MYLFVFSLSVQQQNGLTFPSPDHLHQQTLFQLVQLAQLSGLKHFRVQFENTTHTILVQHASLGPLTGSYIAADLGTLQVCW